jgi:FtsZ-interacting cell division protein ZipA
MSTATLIAIAIAIVALAVALWALFRMRNTSRLRSKFGPEYDRAIQSEGGRSRAEAELLKREKRVEKFNIRELTAQERQRFADAWMREQSLFVDDPRTATVNADHLVTEVMAARGYPMGEFETLAADISVDHPRVVEHYREAHGIAETCSSGRASMEDMRRALIHFRALFEDLLGSTVASHQHEEVNR